MQSFIALAMITLILRTFVQLHLFALCAFQPSLTARDSPNQGRLVSL